LTYRAYETPAALVEALVARFERPNMVDPEVIKHMRLRSGYPFLTLNLFSMYKLILDLNILPVYSLHGIVTLNPHSIEPLSL
jgi:hypothetical protein